jgi:hypothetical protein
MANIFLVLVLTVYKVLLNLNDSCLLIITLCKLQVRMMMLKVVARTVGLHRLILLNFYPFIEKYVQVFSDLCI